MIESIGPAFLSYDVNKNVMATIFIILITFLSIIMKEDAYTPERHESVELRSIRI